MNRLAPDQFHITSLIVHALPENWDFVLTTVQEIPMAEVHTDNTVGKFIVLLETDNEHQILDAINRIQNIKGVLNASMVYHHVEE